MYSSERSRYAISEKVMIRVSSIQLKISQVEIKEKC